MQDKTALQQEFITHHEENKAIIGNRCKQKLFDDCVSHLAQEIMAIPQDKVLSISGAHLDINFF
jgi:hypothetical protein